MNDRPKKTISCKLLIFLHGFLGIGAIFGGGAFMIDPSGDLIKMPLSLLKSSPFPNFLFPGVILFVVLGIIPLITIYGLVTNLHWGIGKLFTIYHTMHWSWNFSLYIGFGLIIWITVQMFLIDTIAVVHLVYIFLGLLIQAVTLLPSVQKNYKLYNVVSTLYIVTRGNSLSMI